MGSETARTQDKARASGHWSELPRKKRESKLELCRGSGPSPNGLVNGRTQIHYAFKKNPTQSNQTHKMCSDRGKRGKALPLNFTLGSVKQINSRSYPCEMLGVLSQSDWLFIDLETANLQQGCDTQLLKEGKSSFNKLSIHYVQTLLF